MESGKGLGASEPGKGLGDGVVQNLASQTRPSKRPRADTLVVPQQNNSLPWCQRVHPRYGLMRQQQQASGFEPSAFAEFDRFSRMVISDRYDSSFDSNHDTEPRERDVADSTTRAGCPGWGCGSGLGSAQRDPEAVGFVSLVSASKAAALWQADSSTAAAALFSIIFALTVPLCQQLLIECSLMNQDSIEEQLYICVNWSREYENRDAMFKTLAVASLVGSIACWCKALISKQGPDPAHNTRAAWWFIMCIVPVLGLQHLWNGEWALAAGRALSATMFTLLIKEATYMITYSRFVCCGALPCLSTLGKLGVIPAPTLMPFSIFCPFYFVFLHRTQTEYLADVLFIDSFVLFFAPTSFACFTCIVATVLSLIYANVHKYR